MKNQKQSMLTFLFLTLSFGLCTMQAQIQEMPEETLEAFATRVGEIETVLKEADVAHNNGDIETFEAKVEEAQNLANPEEAAMPSQPDEPTVAPEQVAAELKAEVAETKEELATEAREEENMAAKEDQEVKEMQQQEVKEEAKAEQPQKEQVETKWKQKMMAKKEDWNKKRAARKNKLEAKHKTKSSHRHNKVRKTRKTKTSAQTK